MHTYSLLERYLNLLSISSRLRPVVSTMRYLQNKKSYIYITNSDTTPYTPYKYTTCECSIKTLEITETMRIPNHSATVVIARVLDMSISLEYTQLP
jgi:hypothetical protein